MLSIALLFLVNENITNNLTCQKIMNPSKKIDYLPVQPLSSHRFASFMNPSKKIDYLVTFAHPFALFPKNTT